MKNQFIIIMFLFGFNGITLGQSAQSNYDEFADSAIWRVDQMFYVPAQWSCSIQHYFHYYTDGDTTINSLSYRKIYRSAVTTNVITCDSSHFIPPPPISGYVGALRDDSTANQTYFVFENTSTDSLLYDYNMLVGDTLKGCLNPIAWQYITVESIDSVSVHGTYRTRWNLTSIAMPWLTELYIIEGVGTSFGLFDPLNYALELIRNDFICAKDGEVLLYSTGYNSPQGCSLVSIDEWKETSKLTAYPNPTNGNVRLDFGKTASDVTLQVISPLGSVIHSERINGIQYTDLELPETNGLYFIQLLNTGEKRSVLKVIKE